MNNHLHRNMSNYIASMLSSISNNNTCLSGFLYLGINILLRHRYHNIISEIDSSAYSSHTVIIGVLDLPGYCKVASLRLGPGPARDNSLRSAIDRVLHINAADLLHALFAHSKR